MTRAAVRHIVIGWVGTVRGPRPSRVWCGADMRSAMTTYHQAHSNTPVCTVCVAAQRAARRIRQQQIVRS